MALPQDDGAGSYTCPASMQPVPFPTDAVTAAADACRAVARLIHEKMAAASSAAGGATASWRGGYADDFDLAWPDTEMSAGDLQERLDRLAGEIDDAASAAAAENLRRAALRENYDLLRQHPNLPR